jgi:ketosteroid isomerase-like protein
VRVARLLSATTLLLVCSATAAQERSSDSYFSELVASAYVEPFRSGDIDRWIQAFGADALALHNHRPIDRGIDAIEDFGRAVHQHFELREYEVEVTDVKGTGQWVYTVGRYRSHFVSKADGSSPFGASVGKFVLLWERQADGQWKIILDMGNSDEN